VSNFSKSIIAACAFTVALLFSAGHSSAQIPSHNFASFRAPPDTRWRTITLGDVEAAYRLLRDNDPGASPELHDTQFVQRLESAHRMAQSRAQSVNSYPGYLAVMAAFATAMGDKHIRSRPIFVMNLPRWPGFIVSKRGDDWKITDTDPSQAKLRGAQLVSCDGVPAESLARRNLAGFRGDWSVGAQQIQYAPWLFVDEGNPFIDRPKTCTLQQAGQTDEITLDWQPIKRDDLLPRLKQAIGTGAAGFGVRRVGDGYWISLQSLQGDQPPLVVKAVEEQKQALRAAHYVVLDLRGNGGGVATIGNDVATALFGREAVESRMGEDAGGEPAGCGGAPDGLWRATQDNIEALAATGATYGKRGYPEVKKLADEQVAAMKAARAKGKDLSGDLSCPAPKVPADSSVQVPSPMRGRLILLTDSLCFSACLSTVMEFRALGAYQVGQTTDAATHFVDLREEYMPSGYSTFTVLQSVHPEIPYQVGPFAPHLAYNGDIADTAKLETWVIEKVVPQLSR
jgi:Peptidase family S41